jgi:putative DNA primase/helicase
VAEPIPLNASRRPPIIVRPGFLHETADDAEEALLRSQAPLYVRGGCIVRPVVDEMPASRDRKTKVARLREVGQDAMVDHLSRAATWKKPDGRSGFDKIINPPKEIAATILSRDGEWRFPRLAGIITTPTMRPDGSIFSQAGYDPATQLLLVDPPQLPRVDDRPSRQTAGKALEFLDSLLDEFPFVDAESRSVALSALITPVVRGAFGTAPLHGASAPVAGSGKSYMFDLASAITSGERAPVLTVGRTEEETEKRLSSALLSGQTIISVDNVNGQLGGDLLCQMIERPVVQVRPLGSSKLIKIESRATCYATGNNIQLVGDMTRRVILCSLNPNMERPELRRFKDRPFDRILADRGRYVAAALTVARAYAVAGYPDPCPALASFEDWSRVVRSALVWLGRADPLETMKRARADDPETTKLRALLHAWHDAAGSRWCETGEIVNLGLKRQTLDNSLVHPALHDALAEVAEDKRGAISSRVLAFYLRKKKGTIINDLRVAVDEDSHTCQLIWRVEQA